MTEPIRALFFVIFLSGTTYLVLAKPLTNIFSYAELVRFRNTWFLVILCAFLSPNYWIFSFVLFFIFFFYCHKQPDNRVIYYLFLLSILPILTIEIPGFAGIRHLLEINYPRILIFAFLIPLLFQSKIPLSVNLKLFRLSSDKYVVSYVLLCTILSFRDNTFTNALRDCLLLFLDIFIPYYTLSRYLNSTEQLNRAFSVMFLTITSLALIGIFESAKHWLLYNAMTSNLSILPDIGRYDTRSGILRASAIFSGPIILGYALIIGFGLLLYLRPLLKWHKIFFIIGIIIVCGLLATVSRGPWVGFAVFIGIYLWTGRERIKYVLLSSILLLLGSSLLILTPAFDKFIQLLPFIGTVRTDTISYRERLFESAWIVIQRHPFFGSTNYYESPEMESMRQGQGIIDIVNSYLQIALSKGFVGLALFLLIFLGLMFHTYKMIKILPPNEESLINMGRILFSILAAILVTISTVSSIDYIPYYYWTFSGITAAYIYVAKQTISKSS